MRGAKHEIYKRLESRPRFCEAQCGYTMVKDLMGKDKGLRLRCFGMLVCAVKY